MPRTPAQLALHRETQKRYRLNHPDKIKVAAQKWRESNRDAYNAVCRALYYRKREQILLRRKLDRQANPEKHKAYYRRYYEKTKHTDYYRVKALARIHAQRSQTKTADNAIVLVAKIKERGARCVYCGERTTNKTATIEHMHPVCKGGGNEAYNLAIACSKCNRSKRDKTPNEFVQSGQLFLL